MGDMKTPDFDDLLAAFDIPDATGLDSKEPIHENHEETEVQLKHTGIGLDHDSLLAHPVVNTTDIPVVSVIVKNTSRQELLEGLGDKQHSGPPLQNGFRGPGTSTDSNQLNSGFSKPFVPTLNGDESRELLGKAPIQLKPEGTPTLSQSFSQFSPISSPESEDTQSSRVDGHQKHERPYFPEASMFVERPVSDNHKSVSPSMFDEYPKDCENASTTLRSKASPVKAEDKVSKEHAESNISDCKDKAGCQTSTPSSPDDNHDSINRNCNSGTNPNLPILHTYVESQTSKLSSCLKALVALNARKDSSDLTDNTDSPVVRNDFLKASPKVPVSPRSPKSPLEALRRPLKPYGSPESVCSDSSGKASPALPAGSPPAIPRVRIKTIKTTSGQIKRTVTSVLPDSETDDIQSACESSPAPSVMSEDSYSNMSPYQYQNVSGDVGAYTALKGTSTVPPTKVAHNKLERHSRRPGKMPSPSVCHNSSGGAKRSVAQPRQPQKKATSTQGGSVTNTSFLPKAMHLANLNLVPHSVAASVAARAMPHQQSQHTLSSSAVCSTVPLVHQVKTPSPHPRPYVPNTAAGTLNRLLNNANPVPTYVPNLNPPPDSNINLPPRGFCCLECGDSFGVERSLAYHYGRRSVHIEVACTHCAKTMVFYNKCALLAHAREHKNSGKVMQCTQLYMKPIAEEQMFVPLSAEPSVNMDISVSTPATTKNQPVMPLYADNVIRHRLRCLECNKQLSDYRALAGHYQRPSEDTEGLICKVCSMLLPNKCSFRAHQRIHAHKSPYCCPECGALSRSADIQKHVKENCLHYTRKAGYKCLHCDTVFKTIHGQKNHIEEKHCEVFYKCSLCPVAFKSSDGCQTHMKNKHNVNKTSPQLIFKCSCETVFKKKQLLFQHFHQNANKRATCVFKCPECSSVFPQKQLLMQHFKSVHGGVFTVEAETNSKPADGATPGQDATPAAQRADAPKRRAEQDGKPRAKLAGWTCGECSQWFPDRDAYVSHMKSNHGKSLKRYPCRQCERSFNSLTSMRRHIRNDHDGKKTYTCWYCTDKKTIFTTCVTLKNHISLMHGIKNPDLSQMPKATAEDSNKSLGGGLPSKTAATNDTRGERRHQKRTVDPDASVAKRPRTQYRCSKCGFTTEDSAEFQQHIPRHKSEENTPQCLHCGLCFTSGLALSRHLFIVHRVKDPEEDGGQDQGEGSEVREDAPNSLPVGSPEVIEGNVFVPNAAEKAAAAKAAKPSGVQCDKARGCHSTQSSSA